MLGEQWHWSNKPPVGTPLDRRHPLAQGLVGCWLFNESGGDRLYDSAGYAHGTLANGAAFGAAGTGIFDGTNDQINCGTSDPIGVGMPWSALARVDVSQLTNNTVISKRNAFSAGNNQFGFNVGGNSLGRLTVTKNNTFVQHSSLTVSTTAGWQDVAVMNDASNSVGYLGGVTATSAAGNWTTGTGTGQTIGIGRLITEASEPFGGSIDFIYLYNRKLSVEDVRQIFADPFQMFAFPVERRYFVPAAPPAGGTTPRLTLLGVG